MRGLNQDCRLCVEANSGNTAAEYTQAYHLTMLPYSLRCYLVSSEIILDEESAISGMISINVLTEKSRTDTQVLPRQVLEPSF